MKEKVQELVEQVKLKLISFWESQSKGTQNLAKFILFGIGFLLLLRMCDSKDTSSVPIPAPVRDTVTVVQEQHANNKLIEEQGPKPYNNTWQRSDYQFSYTQDSRLVKEQLDFLMNADELKNYSNDNIRMAYNSALDRWFRDYLYKNREFTNFEKYLENE